MKTKFYIKSIITICAFLNISVTNLKAQSDYTVDWNDTSTYNVTCGKVITSKWSVKDDSCSMTTPFIRVEASEGSEVIYTFKVNQSGNGEISDRCWVYHSIDTEDWVQDTMFTAGGTPKVFTYNDSVYMNYTHYVRFRITMKTDSHTEFWSITGGDLKVTDGVPALQKIMFYASRPPAPQQDPPTMPVELVSFNGTAAAGQVKLLWTTASETNNDYFTIEKSNDGVAFEPLGYVNGAGNSNIVTEYAFYDNDPFALSYYKLKQTDFDGTSAYSEIIAINTQANNAATMQIRSS
jgi:hypothetical protein